VSNLELWDKVERTDIKHTKAITGKSYHGTSPKPHYLVHKATEAFGPCGIGWGFTIVSERIEEGAGGERMHIAHVRVWYEWQGKRGEVEHIGGTQFSGIRSSGKPFTDEDAPKKSVTDALVKALSMIGFAGDIFMGRYDDSKYVNELRNETPERSSEPRVAPNSSPLLQDRVEKGGSLTVRLSETDPGASTMNARIVKELEVAAAQGLASLGKAWLAAMPDIKRLPEKWELDLVDMKDVLKAKIGAEAK
jgi:hypothetical protein